MGILGILQVLAQVFLGLLFLPVDKPNADMRAATAVVERVRSHMAYPGAEYTKIQWVHCGFANAFYDGEGKRILLCSELIPALQQTNGAGWINALGGIVAHEMGHAVIAGQNLPITGGDEAAADELAAITLGAAGEIDMMLEKAKFWDTIWPMEHYARLTSPEFTDDHPAAIARASTMKCMAAGALKVEPICVARYRRTWERWNRILTTWDEVPGGI